MAKKGIVLPEYQDAVWSYVKAQRDGDKLYIGDHVGGPPPSWALTTAGRARAPSRRGAARDRP